MKRKMGLPTFAAFCLSLMTGGCAHAQADSDFRTAVETFRKGDLAAAQVQAQAAEAAAPNDKKVVALLGWITLRRGDLAATAALLDRLTRLDPDYIETTQLRAWMAYAAGDRATAEQGFEQVLKQVASHKSRPEYPARYPQADVTFMDNAEADGHYGLALLAIARSDWAGAAEQLDAAAVETYLGHPDVQAARADILYRQGKYAQALDTVDRLAAAPRSRAVIVTQVKSLVMSGREDEAVKMAGAERPPSGDLTFSPFVEVLVLAAKGKPTEAETALDQALAAALPDAEANELAERLAAAKPSVRGWAQAVGDKLHQRRWLLASGTFLIAADRQAGCRKLLATAWADTDSGRIADAAAEFRYLADRGCAPQDDIKGGLAYLRQDYVTAIQLIGAEGGNAHLQPLAWSYYFTGDYGSAERLFARVHGPAESLANATAGLGWVAFRQGRTDQAKAAFAKAAKLQPGNPIAQSGLEALKANR